jgi:RsmE family RNA methyltransferase
VPELLPLATLSDSIARSTNEGAQSFVLYEGSGLPPLSGVDVDVTRPVCLFVGPEGGWSDVEVTLVRDLKALPVSLGPRIMRPLPAALTALTLLLHRSRDLQSANQEDMEAR